MNDVQIVKNDDVQLLTKYGIYCRRNHHRLSSNRIIELQSKVEGQTYVHGHSAAAPESFSHSIFNG